MCVAYPMCRTSNASTSPFLLRAGHSKWIGIRVYWASSAVLSASNAPDMLSVLSPLPACRISLHDSVTTIQYHGRTDICYILCCTLAKPICSDPQNGGRGWNEMSAHSRHLTLVSCRSVRFSLLFRLLMHAIFNKQPRAYCSQIELSATYNWGLLNVDAPKKPGTWNRTRIRRSKYCFKKAKVIYRWMSIHWRKVSVRFARTILLTLYSLSVLLAMGQMLHALKCNNLILHFIHSNWHEPNEELFFHA